MMNNRITKLLLPLFILSGLYGCSKQEERPTEWSDEFKSLLQDHYADLPALPFIDLGDYELTFNPLDETILLIGDPSYYKDGVISENYLPQLNGIDGLEVRDDTEVFGFEDVFAIFYSETDYIYTIEIFGRDVPGDEVFNLTVKKEVAPAAIKWKDGLLSMIEQYFPGISIPCVDIGNYDFYYYDEQEALIIEGDYYNNGDLQEIILPLYNRKGWATRDNSANTSGDSMYANKDGIEVYVAAESDEEDYILIKVYYEVR